MTRLPSRRTVLQASAAATAAALAGCVDGGQFDLGSTEYSGDLIVQNMMEESHRYLLRVTEVSGDSDRTVLERRYRVPSATALVYDGVIEGGGEYRFYLRLLGENPRENEWSAAIDACEGDQERNVTISVNRDQLNMTPYRCGETVNLGDGTEVEATNATEYVLNESAGNATDDAGG